MSFFHFLNRLDQSSPNGSNDRFSPQKLRVSTFAGPIALTRNVFIIYSLAGIDIYFCDTFSINLSQSSPFHISYIIKDNKSFVHYRFRILSLILCK